MRLASLAVIVLIPLAAQEIKLPPSIERLADKASDVVDVTMDASMLQLASKFLSDKDADEARVKKLVAGLKSIYVRSFEFDNRGEYQQSDVEDLRAQMRGPGWSRIVTVRSRKSGDNADVFLKTEGGHVSAIGIISAEPKELTIVLINGTLNPEELRELGGHFGIPKMDMSIGAPKSSPKED